MESRAVEGGRDFQRVWEGPGRVGGAGQSFPCQLPQPRVGGSARLRPDLRAAFRSLRAALPATLRGCQRGISRARWYLYGIYDLTYLGRVWP